MTMYRVFFRQTEYRNCYVDADSPERAAEMVLSGDFDDSTFAGAGDDPPVVIDVEEW